MRTFRFRTRAADTSRRSRYARLARAPFARLRCVDVPSANEIRLKDHPSWPGRVAEGMLRVAVLAPISWRVPPRHYGPWEQFASLLTEGLVERGIDVTLFASADSITRARLVGTVPTGYAEDPTVDAKVWEALHIA